MIIIICVTIIILCETKRADPVRPERPRAVCRRRREKTRPESGSVGSIFSRVGPLTRAPRVTIAPVLVHVLARRNNIFFTPRFIFFHSFFNKYRRRFSNILFVYVVSPIFEFISHIFFFFFEMFIRLWFFEKNNAGHVVNTRRIVTYNIIITFVYTLDDYRTIV